MMASIAADLSVSEASSGRPLIHFTVTALRRTQHHGTNLAPEQTVHYVVANADRRGIDRVHLPFEEPLIRSRMVQNAAIRTVENIVSCVNWDHTDIEQYLAETTDTTLGSYCTDLRVS